MFHLIGFIIFGFVVGLIARAVTPGRDDMSLGVTAILGIVGALVAGWLGRALGWYGPDDSAGFIMSTVGAVVLLLAYNFISKRRKGVSTRSKSDRDFPRKVA